MSKTIAEIKKDKNEAETKILTLLTEFEKTSELHISRVIVRIDHLTYDEEQKLNEKPKKPSRKLRGVLDVSIVADTENDPRSIDVY